MKHGRSGLPIGLEASRGTSKRTMWASAAILALASGGAWAQDAGPRPAGAPDQEINPKIIPGAVKPAAPAGLNGPLAIFAQPYADRGITFHILALDFAEDNPSVGIQRGRGANALYVIEGVDADLGKLAGLSGTSLHFENVFFAGVRNLNLAAQIGDSQVGFQPTFTPRIARLSRATVEQTFGKFDFEIGSTHPGYYYALPNCQSLNSCFQDILYLNAGWTSPLFSVPGVNLTYQATPSIYAEAGAFAVQTNANFHVGYDFPDEQYRGVVGLAEIGSKTEFATALYPGRYSLTGFINTANHADYNAGSAFTGTSQTQSGTSGVVVQGLQTVWRQDGGSDPTNPSPTSVVVYGSAGAAIDSTVPIQSDIYVGTTLQSPFANRPADRFGLKFNWERLNPSYATFITTANQVAGGPGFNNPYSRDKFIFEANAHLELALGAAFEPVVQYTLNPNSFFNQTSPTKARDGVYIGGTLIVPVGVILGLAAPKA